MNYPKRIALDKDNNTNNTNKNMNNNSKNIRGDFNSHTQGPISGGYEYKGFRI